MIVRKNFEIKQEELVGKMTDHKFQRHQAVYFANHHKREQTEAVAGKFVVGTDESKPEMPFKQRKDQAKAQRTY